MTTEIKAIKNEKNGTLITGEARIAFPYLFEPRKGEDGKADRWEVIMMIPKSQKCGTMPALGAMVKEAIKKALGDKPAPNGWINPLRDGDAEDLQKYPERKGHWIFRARAFRAPVVVDRNKAEIMDARQIYGGCYVRAEISAAWFDKVSRGVNIYVNLVQKLRDGDPLGAPRASAADLPDLEPVSDPSVAFGGDDVDQFGGY